eukprot:GEMP01028260.1.p1 GENE.GEMP01028260.1~~GEMP01028260.1.p1  ORF type:complete len:435 (+),score=128.79 GEMP01028260.1:87-1391(+)
MAIRPFSLCSICQEDVKADCHVRCSGATRKECHVFCDECFIQHVENVEQYRIKDKNGRVPCPVDWHGATFDDDELAAAYIRKHKTRELGRYIRRALAPLAAPDENDENRRRAVDNSDDDDNGDERNQEVMRLADRLLFLLNIRCPRCDVPQDPDPDGCRAVRCQHCGCYFCWVCFEIVNSDHANHLHGFFQHGDVFLSQQLVDASHESWRATVVRTFLAREVLPVDDNDLCERVIQRVIDQLRDVDRDLVLLISRVAAVAATDDAPMADARRHHWHPRAMHRRKLTELSRAGRCALSSFASRSHSKFAEDAAREAALQSSWTEWVYHLSGMESPVLTRSLQFHALFGAARGAAVGTLVVEGVCVVYDALRWLVGYKVPRQMNRQMKNRLYNATLNCGGAAMGALVGSVLWPSMGASLGPVLGLMIVSYLQRPVE